MAGSSTNQNNAVFTVEQVQQLMNMAGPTRTQAGGFMLVPPSPVPSSQEVKYEVPKFDLQSFQPNQQPGPSTSAQAGAKGNQSIAGKTKNTSGQKTTLHQQSLYVEAMKSVPAMSTPDRAFWEDLTEQLNSVPGAPRRSVEEWQRVFRRWRYAANKKAKALTQKKPGNQQLVKPLTDLQKKFRQMQKTKAKGLVGENAKTVELLTEIAGYLKQIVELKSRKLTAEDEAFQYESPDDEMEEEDA